MYLKKLMCILCAIATASVFSYDYDWEQTGYSHQSRLLFSDATTTALAAANGA